MNEVAIQDDNQMILKVNIEVVQRNGAMYSMNMYWGHL